MMGTISFIPLLPPLTETIVDKDRLAKERWVGTITAGQGHHQIHPHY